ncbi:MAG: hypothetical protein ACE148_07565 [Vicinamibacterales bacterium]
MAAVTLTSQTMLALGIALLLSAPSPATAAGPRSKWMAAPACRAITGATDATVQQRRPDMVFSLVPLTDGRRELALRAGALELRKKVAPNGATALRLESPEDSLDITISAEAVTVGRGRGSAVLSSASPDEASMLEVQRVLAGSLALRQLRALAADLESVTDSGPEVAAIALSDAVLGFLAGDAGAPARLASRMKSRREARMRQVLLRQQGCYPKWEQEVLYAWAEYQACLDDFEWWNPLKEACTIRYLLWVESAWFQFLGCSALPFNQ